ncbi:MAG: helix-hairpin-helix domain-containing protein, partial [Bacteroidia bacterium]|nr:helix-hairpin-helix domain-containing protein [Bacteroidia bacterium]
MKWKEFITDYLTFSRKDRIGILVLSALILFIFLLPKFISKTNHPKPSAADTAWIESMKMLEIKEPVKDYEDDGFSYQYDRPKNSYSQPSKTELFFFDPNIITITEWEKLGIAENTIRTIRNYLSKGGFFKKPEDLKKIYGLHSKDYERLAPYIKIEASPSKDIPGTHETTSTFKPFPSHYSVIDINDADTTAFISLPGIGSKLAARIINFRDKLGGFYSISQVGETFGLPDSTYQKIKKFLNLNNTLIRKININKATVDELKAHPYISWSLANPIVAYRNEHGPFLKVEDIKNVMVVTDEVYNK